MSAIGSDKGVSVPLSLSECKEDFSNPASNLEEGVRAVCPFEDGTESSAIDDLERGMAKAVVISDRGEELPVTKEVVATATKVQRVTRRTILKDIEEFSIYLAKAVERTSVEGWEALTEEQLEKEVQITKAFYQVFSKDQAEVLRGGRDLYSEDIIKKTWSAFTASYYTSHHLEQIQQMWSETDITVDMKHIYVRKETYQILQDFLKGKVFVPGDTLMKGGFGMVAKVNIGKKTYALKELFSPPLFEERAISLRKEVLPSICFPPSTRAMPVYLIQNFEEGSSILMPLAAKDVFTELIEEGVDDPVPAVLEIAESAIEVSKILDEHGQSHYDIKPGNVLKLQDGKYVVGDFGAIQSKGSFKKGGTFGYCPPEFFNKNVKDGSKFDMWSLGVTIFNLLASNQRKKKCLHFICALMEIYGLDPNWFDEGKEGRIMADLSKMYLTSKPLLIEQAIDKCPERNGFTKGVKRLLVVNPEDRISPHEAKALIKEIKKERKETTFSSADIEDSKTAEGETGLARGMVPLLYPSGSESSLSSIEGPSDPVRAITGKRGGAFSALVAGGGGGGGSAFSRL